MSHTFPVLAGLCLFSCSIVVIIINIIININIILILIRIIIINVVVVVLVVITILNFLFRFTMRKTGVYIQEGVSTKLGYTFGNEENTKKIDWNPKEKKLEKQQNYI